MPIPIDFANLDLRSAFDLAIGIEEDAQLRYQEFASMVDDADAAQFFSDMANNEERHRRSLESQRDVLSRHAPPRFDTSIAEGVEAPNPAEVARSMSAREAMELALRAEIRAHEFYASAAPNVRDAGVRQLFENLKEAELEHEQTLRKLLQDLDDRCQATRAARSA